MKNIKTKILALWPLLLPVVLFWRNPTGFPYPGPEALYSDISISHYPNAVFLKQTLGAFAEIPLWSPAILSGYPFGANPLSGLWYPPGWIALLFPLPLGFNLAAGLHILWGGVGLYSLARKEGLLHWAATFGALAFMFFPKWIAHYGAGHLTLFYAVSWTPWLLWAARQGGKRQLFPPVILAAICLADPRWAAFAGMLWVFYVVAYSLRRASQENPDRPRVSRLRSLQGVLGSLLKLFGQVGIAILLSSPILLPLLEYTQLATRANLSSEDMLVFSLPVARLLGLFFPDFGGNHELMVYLGGVVISLVFLSITRKGKSPKERFWLWAGFVSLAYALGSNIPFFSMLTHVPGLRFLRVPSRSLFLLGVSFAVVSAYALDFILKPIEISQQKKTTLLFTGLAALAVSFTGGIWVLTKEFPLNFVFGASILCAAVLSLGLIVRQKMTPKTGYLLLVGLALLDWSLFDHSVLSFRPKEEVLSEQKQVAEYLSSREGRFRVYSPSYSLPQQVSIHYGLELADGVDPLQLATYSAFMQEASGVPILAYSVTLPPFENGNPALDNAQYRPDLGLLGLLNVGYVVSEYDLPVEGLELREQFGATKVFENTLVYPRAWVQPEEGRSRAEIRGVDIKTWQPNRIELTANGPGLLVLSEINYPGWRAEIDGQNAQIQTLSGILRAVPLAEGVHKITYRFQPVSVIFGIGGFLLGGLVLIFFWWKMREGKK